MGCSIYELKIFFVVSCPSQDIPWVTRGLKIGISAILIDLHISIASKPQKSDVLQIILCVICHFWYVAVLFRMLLLGPICYYLVLKTA